MIHSRNSILSASVQSNTLPWKIRTCDYKNNKDSIINTPLWTCHPTWGSHRCPEQITATSIFLWIFLFPLLSLDVLPPTVITVPWHFPFCFVTCRCQDTHQYIMTGYNVPGDDGQYRTGYRSLKVPINYRGSCPIDCPPSSSTTTSSRNRHELLKSTYCKSCPVPANQLLHDRGHPQQV